MTIEKPKVSEALLSLFFAASYEVVLVLSWANVSGAPPVYPGVGPGQVALAGAVAGLFLAGGGVWLFTRSRRGVFIYGVAAYVVVALVGVTLSALFIHRDFLTVTFQLIIIGWILFIGRIDLFITSDMDRRLVRWTSRITMVSIIVLFLWLLLMGYAIVTRQEPRWFESTFYNVYNFLLIVILGTELIRLRHRLGRIVSVSVDRLWLDDYELTPLMNRSAIRILYFLAGKPDRRGRCAEIHAFLDQYSAQSGALDCAGCTDSFAKATLCPGYKHIYNCLLNVKKFLDVFEIGTIQPPRNKRRILQEGWRLAISPDVTLERRDLPQGRAGSPMRAGAREGKVPAAE